MPVIVVEMNETQGAAMERHFAEHPEDRNTSNSLIVQLVELHPRVGLLSGEGGCRRFLSASGHGRRR